MVMVSKLLYLLMDWETFNFFMAEVPIMSIDLLWFLYDLLWFLHDRDLRHERDNCMP